VLSGQFRRRVHWFSAGKFRVCSRSNILEPRNQFGEHDGPLRSAAPKFTLRTPVLVTAGRSLGGAVRRIAALVERRDRIVAKNEPTSGARTF